MSSLQNHAEPQVQIVSPRTTLSADKRARLMLLLGALVSLSLHSGTVLVGTVVDINIKHDDSIITISWAEPGYIASAQVPLSNVKTVGLFDLPKANQGSAAGSA